MIQSFIGRLIEIRDRRWHKPQKVRVIDAELDDQGAVWFWAKYA